MFLLWYGITGISISHNLPLIFPLLKSLVVVLTETRLKLNLWQSVDQSSATWHPGKIRIISSIQGRKLKNELKLHILIYKEGRKLILLKERNKRLINGISISPEKQRQSILRFRPQTISLIFIFISVSIYHLPNWKMLNCYAN